MNIVLDKLRDVVNLNAFVAFRPTRAKLIYKTSKSTGLWQLDLVDLENEKNLWTVGHYVDGFEDRSVEYDVFVKRYWRGYADAVYSDECPRYVVQWQSGYIFIMLPNEYEEKVVIAAPQVCKCNNVALQEPVYIWRYTSGQYCVLDCANKLYVFEALNDLENWIRAEQTIEDSNKKLRVLWRKWYVIPERLSGEEKWNFVIRKAKMGDYKPNPNEVVELVRRLT